MKGRLSVIAVNSEILEAKEVAKMLKISVRTVGRLADRGELRGFKVGDLWRFYLSDVQAYIDNQIRKQQEKRR
jgi:excisionase family DNA binding protein